MPVEKTKQQWKSAVKSNREALDKLYSFRSSTPSMPLNLHISLTARLYRQCTGTGSRGSELMHWWEGSEGNSARYAKKSWFWDGNFHFSILAEIILHQKRDLHLRWLGTTTLIQTSMLTVQDLFNHSLISRPCIILKCMKLHLTFWKICFKSKRHYWLSQSTSCSSIPSGQMGTPRSCQSISQVLQQTKNAYKSTDLSISEDVPLSLLSFIYYINVYLNCFCRCCCKLWCHAHTCLSTMVLWGKWPCWGVNSPGRSGSLKEVWRTPCVMMTWLGGTYPALGKRCCCKRLAGSQVSGVWTLRGSWLWGPWRGGKAVAYTLLD